METCFGFIGIWPLTVSLLFYAHLRDHEICTKTDNKTFIKLNSIFNTIFPNLKLLLPINRKQISLIILQTLTVPPHILIQSSPNQPIILCSYQKNQTSILLSNIINMPIIFIFRPSEQ